ncbi:MAG: hypothetical protein RL757_2592 [Bacteroidota bacterium]|jgi:hypothetical protein
MKKHLILFFALLQTTVIFAQRPMAVIWENSTTWRFIDTEGRDLFKTAADWGIESPTMCYANGFFCVSKPNLEGQQSDILLNEKGEIAWNPNFDFNVKIMTPPDELGYLLVENRKNHKCFITNFDHKILSPMEAGLEYLGKGVVVYPDWQAKTEVNLLFNIISQRIIRRLSGITVLQASEDRIAVMEEDEDGEKVGFIDFEGNYIIPIKYESLGDILELKYENKRVYLTKKETVYGFNTVGKATFSMRGDNDVLMAGHGFAKVGLESGGMLMYDLNGSPLHAMPFDDIGDVNAAGCFYFKRGKNMGIMNIRGDILLESDKYVSGENSEMHIFLKNSSGIFDVFDKNGAKVNQIEAEWIGKPEFGKVIFANKTQQKGVLKDDGTPILPAILGGELILGENYFVNVIAVNSRTKKYVFYNDNGQKVLDDAEKRFNTQLIVPILNQEQFIK